MNTRLVFDWDLANLVQKFGNKQYLDKFSQQVFSSFNNLRQKYDHVFDNALKEIPLYDGFGSQSFGLIFYPTFEEVKCWIYFNIRPEEYINNMNLDPVQTAENIMSGLWFNKDYKKDEAYYKDYMGQNLFIQK